MDIDIHASKRAACNGVSGVVLTCALVWSGASHGGSIDEIVRDIEPGQWRELPDTRLRDVFPERESHPHWGNMGPKAVTRAWSGGAFDSRRNRLVLKGGGHGAYGGNEVYEFDIENMRWRRSTEPSKHEVDPAYTDHRASDQYYRTLDGTPVSRHTYDGMVYLPNIDKILMWGGSLYSIGRAYDSHAWLYSPEDASWHRGSEAKGSNHSVSSGYDPKAGIAVIDYGNGIYGYDPITDKWHVISGGDNSNNARVAAVDPERRLFVQLRSRAGPVVYYDLDAPSGRQVAPVEGDTGFDAVPIPGIAYHPPSGYMVIWNGWGQTWVLDPDTWQIRKLDNLSGSAPDHYGTDRYPIKGKYKTIGIYGRWAYVPDYDVFIAYGHVDDNVWLYKLPDDPFEWKPVGGRSAGGRDCPADLCVGPDFNYRLPSHAAHESRPGDVIAIQEGEYEDCARWRHSVTIKGIDGTPRIGNKVCRSKAVWIVQGDETVIENVELYGGRGPGRNGEGIRHEGKRLVVRDSVLHKNRMGILTNHDEDMVLELYNNEFYGMDSWSGLAHQVYAGRIGHLIAEGNYFHEGSVGHYIKSVARRNEIRYNYLRSHNQTRAAVMDLWGCSESDIVGNVMTYAGDGGALQGISFTHRNHRGKRLECDRETSANIAFNTAVFLSENKRWSSFVRNQFGIEYTIANNLVINTRDLEFEGSETGYGRLIGNLHLNEYRPELFMDPDNDDFRPKKVTNTAEDIGFEPNRIYKHPRALSNRASANTPGAYEAVE